MLRALVLTFAFGLTPALAEDIGTGVIDGLPFCEGACPETTVTAMSADEDGDGDAEYVEINDPEAELTLAEANCTADTADTCVMPIDDLDIDADQL